MFDQKQYSKMTEYATRLHILRDPVGYLSRCSQTGPDDELVAFATMHCREDGLSITPPTQSLSEIIAKHGDDGLIQTNHVVLEWENQLGDQIPKQKPRQETWEEVCELEQ